MLSQLFTYIHTSSEPPEFELWFRPLQVYWGLQQLHAISEEQQEWFSGSVLDAGSQRGFPCIYTPTGARIPACMQTP